MPTYSENARENALADSSGDSLSELFERDPLHLTDQDLQRMVDEMRKHRHEWIKEEQAAKQKGKKQNHQRTKEKVNLDIDTLDIDL